jgi:hypothetical protein
MQQLRVLKKYSLQSDNYSQLEPNKQFIWDLQAWIQHLQAQGHLIILNIDNNKDFYAAGGNYHPLPYQPSVHVTDKTHDGNLRTLAASCGLIDILALQHSSRPFPPTYIRGKKRIDYILISANLQDAVECSGILPYNAIFSGDHKPCFLDFNADLLFAGSTPPLAPPCQRSLQLFDPRKVNEYRTVLHKQLDYHKVFDKLKTLKEAAESGNWSQD